MKEKPQTNEVRVTFSDDFGKMPMTFVQFQEEQQKLREKSRATSPYIKVEGGYSDAMLTVNKLSKYNLEGNPNIALGGVAIFIDSEPDFKNLDKFSTETASTIYLTERQ